MSFSDRSRCGGTVTGDVSPATVDLSEKTRGNTFMAEQMGTTSEACIWHVNPNTLVCMLDPPELILKANLRNGISGS